MRTFSSLASKVTITPDPPGRGTSFFMLMPPSDKVSDISAYNIPL